MADDAKNVSDQLANGITIQDVADLVQIIDYAAEQGAFKGWNNIRQILSVRDKAANFVSIVKAQQEQQNKEEETKNESK